uniref:homing endonuclease n=1 Tax=Leptographium procerum TaxID=100367 RepID=UPI0023F551A2|nr:homing endonuclease [Leptographium procerum]WDW21006.1 homing endonuclease [Leptographium procerum]
MLFKIIRLYVKRENPMRCSLKSNVPKFSFSLAFFNEVVQVTFLFFHLKKLKMKKPTSTKNIILSTEFIEWFWGFTDAEGC